MFSCLNRKTLVVSSCSSQRPADGVFRVLHPWDSTQRQTSLLKPLPGLFQLQRVSWCWPSLVPACGYTHVCFSADRAWTLSSGHHDRSCTECSLPGTVWTPASFPGPGVGQLGPVEQFSKMAMCAHARVWSCGRPVESAERGRWGSHGGF